MSCSEAARVCAKVGSDVKCREDALVFQLDPRHSAAAEFAGLGKSGELTAVQGVVKHGYLSLVMKSKDKYPEC